PAASRRRTGESQAHAPLVANRDKHERIQPAGQRLGVGAEPFVDSAASLFAQKNARPIGMAVPLVETSPRRSRSQEQWQFCEARFLLPSLRLDPPTLLLTDPDVVLLAACSAGLAVPVLDERQRMKRDGHE